MWGDTLWWYLNADLQYVCCMYIICMHFYTTLACTHHTVVQLDFQAMEWRKQPRAFPHITDRHLFCYSFFFTASVPQKEMIYSSLFPWLNNVC